MIAESLIPEFDHEMAVTRKLLECTPDEQLAWKPHAKSFSMGELFRHIVEIPSWMGVTIEQDVLEAEAEVERLTGLLQSSEVMSDGPRLVELSEQLSAAEARVEEAIATADQASAAAAELERRAREHPPVLKLIQGSNTYEYWFNFLQK